MRSLVLGLCALCLLCMAHTRGKELGFRNPSDKQHSHNRSSLAHLHRSLLDEDAQYDDKNLRQECMQKYGQRKFVAPRQQVPPLLWTFPGSGNTWARLLIDYATGVFTGSVYNDRALRSALPGEGKCDRTVAMIKAHPHLHPFSVLDNGPWNEKCSSIPRFTKAVLLLRDPFDSIWSEFLRRMTGSHVGSVYLSKFDRERWLRQAKSLADDYNNMWEQSYKPFIDKYPNGYLFVKYEDLANASTRSTVLQQWLAFIGYPIDDDRLKCAVVLSRHPRIRRVPKANTVTKAEGYEPSVVCELWRMIRHNAEPAGYQIWRNTSCEGGNVNASQI